jgi:hypothetical protein
MEKINKIANLAIFVVKKSGSNHSLVKHLVIFIHDFGYRLFAEFEVITAAFFFH